MTILERARVGVHEENQRQAQVLGDKLRALFGPDITPTYYQVYRESPGVQAELDGYYFHLGEGWTHGFPDGESLFVYCKGIGNSQVRGLTWFHGRFSTGQQGRPYGAEDWAPLPQSAPAYTPGSAFLVMQDSSESNAVTRYATLPGAQEAAMQRMLPGLDAAVTDPEERAALRAAYARGAYDELAEAYARHCPDAAVWVETVVTQPAPARLPQVLP